MRAGGSTPSRPRARAARRCPGPPRRLECRPTADRSPKSAPQLLDAIARAGDLLLRNAADDVELRALLLAGSRVARADLENSGSVERKRHFDRRLTARPWRQVV